MLLMVTAPASTKTGTAAETPDSSDTKKTDSKEGAHVVNVELDLDDAPFLEEPEPEQKPEQQTKQEDQEQSAPVAMPDAAQKLSLKERLLLHKKKLIIGGGAFVLLLIVLVVLKMFLFSSPTPPPHPAEPAPPVATHGVPQETAAAHPEAPAKPPGPLPPKHLIEVQPFWVPLTGPQGETVFFIYDFSIPTDDDGLAAEIGFKTTILRDAVYYYLLNRTLNSLTSETGAQDLQNALIDVLNTNLTAGKITKLYIKDFYTVGS